MSYEYMQGMGTAEQATQFVAQAREANSRDDFLQAATLLGQAIAADPSRAGELGALQVQMYAEGGNCSEAQRIWAQISPSLAPGDPNRAQYQQYVDNCQSSAGAAATGKQTWWEGGDIEGMFSSFASKLGIGQQTPAPGAQQPAAGPTSFSQIAPDAGGGPSVSVEDDSETPWYVQFAPHMAIGGLGLGAVVVLVIAMKKRG